MPRRLSLALLFAFAALPVAALAQIPGLPVPAASTSAGYGFPVKRVGNLDTATITFQGVRLFTIAAPVASDANDVPPIVQRVETIEDNLRRVVPPSTSGTLFNPSAARFETGTFKVEIGSENGYATLYATDGRHKDVAPLMTLTQSDSAYYALSSKELAEQWQAALQSALAPAVQAAQPEYIKRQLQMLPFVVIGALLLTFLASLIQKSLDGRREVLEERVEALGSEAENQAAAGRLRLQDNLLSTGRWILSIVVLAMWALVALWMLSVVPATQAFARLLASRVVRVLVLWLIVLLLDRGLSVIFARLADAWEAIRFSHPAIARGRCCAGRRCCKQPRV